jgi:stage V sporulation protein S
MNNRATHSDPQDTDDYIGVMDEPEINGEIIKVSAKSRSTAVAGAIAGVIRERRYAEVQAIGAGAVNQAVKALAIARGYLDRDSIDIVFTPYFTEVNIDGQERTAVRFSVEPRQLATLNANPHNHNGHSKGCVG